MLNCRVPLSFVLLASVAIALAFYLLLHGTVYVSLSDILAGPFSVNSSIGAKIFWNIRMPRLFASVLSGISLSVAGLSLQTLFRNPLAGPFVLGISGGASLGVALSLLAGFSFGRFGVLSAAAIGAFAVTVVVMLIARRFENSTVLLIVGLLLGYFIDALVTLLVANSDAQALKVYVSWGMGSFGRLTLDGIAFFAIAAFFGCALIAFSVKFLNAARLGEDFAYSLGVDVRRYKFIVLLGASVLAAASTAYCGPVAFVGIAVPHLAFMLFKTSNHRVLLPGSAMCGVVLCLLASMFTTIPLNATLSLVGVPVVLWIAISYKGANR